MGLDKLKNWILKLKEGLGVGEGEAESGKKRERFIPPISRKRPKNFFVPKWARKDWFAKKDLGTMAPPKELREGEGAAAWLKSKLKKDKKEAEPDPARGKKKDKIPTDQELGNFLEDYLGSKNKRRRKRRRKIKKKQ